MRKLAQAFACLRFVLASLRARLIAYREWLTIYGNEDAVSPKAIDVHMHHLRTKLGEGVGEMIQTVRGFGYKFLLESRQA